MFGKSLVYLAAALGAANAASYKATMTAYGSSDNNGSGNCVKTGACGYYFDPGYTAAVSQNLYGAGPSEGAGPACGKCYALTAEKDSSGNALSGAGKSVVVRVDNLCPASGNSVCSMKTLSDTNSYGANVNFDLCIDSGASKAVFGGDSIGLAQGTAEEVSCDQWSGKQVGDGWKRHALAFSG